mmetsp:Transcript_23965/g.47702  ORF Transcript_23965/g.47702 Transcript_23965/m.47702 type:complete len:230 (+) Transcript_23965:314-1003(+)
MFVAATVSGLMSGGVGALSPPEPRKAAVEGAVRIMRECRRLPISRPPGPLEPMGTSSESLELVKFFTTSSSSPIPRGEILSDIFLDDASAIGSLPVVTSILISYIPLSSISEKPSRSGLSLRSSISLTRVGGTGDRTNSTSSSGSPSELLDGDPLRRGIIDLLSGGWLCCTTGEEPSPQPVVVRWGGVTTSLLESSLASFRNIDFAGGFFLDDGRGLLDWKSLALSCSD